MQTINTSNLNEARKQIQELKKENKEIAVISKDEDFNRKILEIKGINLFVVDEKGIGKDSLKQRNSQLNQVLCKMAKKNDISIGINFEEISKLEKKQKVVAIARLVQNIKLCRKNKNKIIILPKNKYQKQDILGFLIALKSSTQQAKLSFD